MPLRYLYIMETLPDKSSLELLLHFIFPMYEE
jgi:hypothetical protein